MDPITVSWDSVCLQQEKPGAQQDSITAGRTGRWMILRGAQASSSAMMGKEWMD